MATLRFDGFEFDTATGELRKGSRLVRLEPQPAALLALLASRPGELVTRDEIRRRIWGDDTHVNLSESLAYCVRAMRVALEDDARAPRFVETIPRRGYRFLIPGPAPAEGRGLPADMVGRTARWAAPRRLTATAALVLLLGAACWTIERRPNHHHEIAVGALRTVHGLLF